MLKFASDNATKNRSEISNEGKTSHGWTSSVILRPCKVVGAIYIPVSFKNVITALKYVGKQSLEVNIRNTLMNHIPMLFLPVI